MSGPYESVALRYWELGWRGVLPLPVRDKFPPPRGFTGGAAPFPSYADVYAWLEGPEGAGNVALRMPRDVLGLDIDAYDGKLGHVTLAACEERWGPLPTSYRLSSRTDGISGIYLYRVPEGMRWAGEAGPNVETIQYRHRYAVAYPSVHPNGGVYHWHAPDGTQLTSWDEVPAPSDLPELPEAWITGLTGGRHEFDVDKLAADDDTVRAWRAARPSGVVCSEVSQSVKRITEQLRTRSNSRHESMARGVMRLAHLGAEGHIGTDTALTIVHAVFLSAATTGEGARSGELAEREWQRALSGAVGVALAEQLDGVSEDPCRVPIPGALAPASGAGVPLSGAVGPADELGAGGAAQRTGDELAGAQGGEGDTPPPGARDERQGSSTFLIDLPDSASPELALRIQDELLRQRARDIVREALDAQRERARFRIPPFADVRSELDIPPVDIPYVIDSVLPADANVVLTAQYKTGKTTLVNNLARALIDDEDFLGKWKVNALAGTVSIWNYEVSQNMYREWLRSLSMKNTERLHVMHLRGFTVPFTLPDVQNWVIDWLRVRETAVWIVDPFARALGAADENSNTEVTRWLDCFDEIKQRAGVSVGVVVTHTGRAVEAAERSRGASRIDDWADVRWLLTRDDEGSRYFRATGRDVEEPEGSVTFDPLTRRLSLSGGERPKRLRPRTGRPTDGELADLIVTAVMETPGMSKRAVAERVRASRPAREASIYDMIRRLEQQKLVTIIEGRGNAQSVYPPHTAAALKASGVLPVLPE